MVAEDRKRRTGSEARWTPEDDLDPDESYSAGANGVRGWMRAVAVLVAIAFLAPLVISAVRLVLR